MAMILLICVFLLMNLQQIEQKPLLMSQSRLRWNATNEVLIAARSSINNLVDISMEIYAYPSSLLIFRQTLQAKVAGSLNRVKFFVPGGKTRSDSYRLVVRVQNDSESLERIILGAPDLRSIYLQTDKTVYKPTDIVKVRALPLTTSGKLYDGPVDFALVNPDGFELIHKNRSTSNNRFIAVEFQLPDHLAFGEWKILARPDRQKPYTYSLTFQVYKYELSPFIVHVLAKETGDFDLYEIDILARYANGQRVSGQVSIWCNCNANNSAATSSNSEKSFLCVLKSSKYVFGTAGSGCSLHHDRSCYICVRHLLLCRVTLGRCFVQNSCNKMAHSPPGHHSVMGQPRAGGLNYPEYVIYRGEQAYPEYVIVYRIVNGFQKFFRRRRTQCISLNIKKFYTF
ncbi:Poly [ADP-ribose] polymerase tankyrase-2 [Dirofilaria immitis]